MKELMRLFVVRVLTHIAKLVIRKYHPRIILVTGSVGKTSTKDAIFTALAPHAFIRKSEKSFNSDIGVTLAILGVPNGWSNPWIWIHNIFEGILLLIIDAPYPRWLVLEVGADRPGDISKALSWLRPNIVVATRFPDIPVHVEYYRTTDDVRAEEISPVGWLERGGVLVGNADDDYVRAVSTPNGSERITFGIDTPSNVYASGIDVAYEAGVPVGMRATINFGGESHPIILGGVLGKTHLYAVLAGITTALSIGIELKDAVGSFTAFNPTPGRMRIIEGKNATTIIDDSYNSSPAAAEEALRSLQRTHGKRKIAVLGDMLELGSFSGASHEMIGELVPGSADVLVTIGPRARAMGPAAQGMGFPQGNIYQFERSTEALAFLEKFTETGDIILVKGSQGVRTERVVKGLMREPERAAELLVRHDPAWLMRA